ncbi:hypothetical protein AMS68_007324 [Peltaster fructicola]|uniref:Protein MAK16 n=1 Tax=Peltaster fructicola TaxID=286661 RepID=A0A6H0Y456_9PEZI|nr:hypothetical protein AMS68_007324 [Peltaster fructicola]
MASDDLIWDIINHQFCSFKLKLPGNASSTQKSTKSTFCRNEHNVTGLCNKQSCPLANSRYATVRADPQTQRLYLYIKTIERSHLPNKWWEKIRLSSNYTKALQQIDERLIYWPKFLLHKCKQRLTRLTQVRVRAQRLAREEERLGETLVSRLAPKVRRREETRERKAERAANIERAIERELIERLRSGAYGDKPLNVEENVWKKVLKGLERAGEGERDVDLDDGIEEEDENEYEYEREDGNVEYVSDLDESDAEDDLEDFEDWLGGSDDDAGQEADSDDGSEPEAETSGLKRKRQATGTGKARKKSSKGPTKGIEYEYEPVPKQRAMELA